MSRHVWSKPYIYDAYLAILESPESPEWELVRELDVGRGSFAGAGRAWIVRDVRNGVTCLQSYATIVSVYLGDGKTKDLGDWSRTTKIHQNKFRYEMSQYGGEP